MVALGDRVCGVLLPAVLFVHGAERCVDAAGCQCGVRIVAGALAYDDRVDAQLGQFDGGAQPRSAGADHEHRCCKTSLVLRERLGVLSSHGANVKSAPK